MFDQIFKDPLNSPLGMKLLGYFMMIFANGIFAMTVWAYLGFICPLKWAPFAPTTLIFVFLELGVGLFLLFNIVYNYFMACKISPGSAPSISEALENIDKKFTGVCYLCHSAKVPRSQHCTNCKTCVLKLDHHCPWIGQCVGQENQKYFILFISWLFVGALFVLVVFGPVVWKINLFVVDENISRIGQKLCWLSVILSATMIPTLTIFGVFHFFLVARNITTVEVVDFLDSWSDVRDLILGRVRSQYDTKDFNKNFSIVFGSSALWFLSWVH